MAPGDPTKGHGKCGATKRSGGQCGRPAGWGTQHAGWGRCKLHGGSTPNHIRAAEVEQTRRDCMRLSIPIEINPDEALLGELYRTAGFIATYDAFVRELELTEGQHWGRMYGPTGMVTGEAKPHVAVELLFRERRHLADVSVAALRANIDERRIQIVEDQATMVHRAFEAALEAAKLSVEQRQEARQAYGAHLRLAA